MKYRSLFYSWLCIVKFKIWLQYSAVCRSTVPFCDNSHHIFLFLRSILYHILSRVCAEEVGESFVEKRMCIFGL